MEREQLTQRLALSRAALAWAQFQRQAQPSREYKVFHALRKHMVGCWSELDVRQSVLSRVLGIRSHGSQSHTRPSDSELLKVKHLCTEYLKRLRAQESGTKPTA